MSLRANRIVLCFIVVAGAVRAQTPMYEMAPIKYSESTPHDPVAELQKVVEKKPATLSSDWRDGEGRA